MSLLSYLSSYIWKTEDTTSQLHTHETIPKLKETLSYSLFFILYFDYY
jgi:hypothetical protein